MSKRVLITGATGFVGVFLCQCLAEAGYVVRAAVRSGRTPPTSASETVIVGDIGSRTDWTHALDGVTHVVHCAARAHVMNDLPENAGLYTEINELGTARLAEAAVSAGIHRFVFLSSVKVNGEERAAAWTRDDPPAPHDPYATSKMNAERRLAEIAAGSALEYAIVRPPLVYGPGVRANFLRLMRWVDRELPLPLGGVRNRRSLVSVWNLCSFVEAVLAHPAAIGRVWMTADGEDLSTPELIRRVANAMHRRVWLLPIPSAALLAMGTLIGKRAEVSRLCGSLAVDASPAQRELGWISPLSVDAGLARTVEWYLAAESRKR